VINFSFSLRNPWWNRSGNVFYREGKTPWLNKFWELQIDRDDTLFVLGFQINHRVSHAGASFEIGALGYWLNISLYDSRHWDYDNNTWQKYE